MITFDTVTMFVIGAISWIFGLILAGLSLGCWIGWNSIFQQSMPTSDQIFGIFVLGSCVSSMIGMLGYFITSICLSTR